MPDPLATALDTLSGSSLPRAGFRTERGTVSPTFQGFLARRNTSRALELLDARDRVDTLRQRSMARVEGQQAVGKISRLDPSSETYRDDIQKVLSEHPNALLDDTATRFINLGLGTANIHEGRREEERVFKQRKQFARFTDRLLNKREEERFKRKAESDLESAILELSPRGQERALAHLEENPDNLFHAVMIGKRFDDDLADLQKFESEGFDPEALETFISDDGVLDRPAMAKWMGEQVRADKEREEKNTQLESLQDINRDISRLITEDSSQELVDQATTAIRSNIEKMYELRGLPSPFQLQSKIDPFKASPSPGQKSKTSDSDRIKSVIEKMKTK